MVQIYSLAMYKGTNLYTANARHQADSNITEPQTRRKPTPTQTPSMTTILASCYIKLILA